MGGPRQLGQGHEPQGGGDAGQGQDGDEWVSHGSGQHQDGQAGTLQGMAAQAVPIDV